MLKVKSFKMSEDEKINEFLDKYILAKGASIFVSNGEILIPYEDGTLMNDSHYRGSVAEQMNIIFAQKEVIEHSQDVLDFLIEDAESRVNEAEADLAEAKKGSGKEKYNAIKDAESKINATKTALAQLDMQKRQNEQELLRMNINIAQFEQRLEDFK